MTEKWTGRHVRCLHIDNDLEFCSNEFNDFCKVEGAFLALDNAPYSVTDDVAKRMNRTLMEKVKVYAS